MLDANHLSVEGVLKQCDVYGDLILDMHKLTFMNSAHPNAGEDGRCKTVIVAGESRARVSSFCKKHTMRDIMRESFRRHYRNDSVMTQKLFGTRTRNVDEIIMDIIRKEGFKEHIVWPLDVLPRPKGKKKTTKQSDEEIENEIEKNKAIMEDDLSKALAIFFGEKGFFKETTVFISQEECVELATYLTEENMLHELMQAYYSTKSKANIEAIVTKLSTDKQFKSKNELCAFDILLFGRMSTNSFFGSIKSPLSSKGGVTTHRVDALEDFFVQTEERKRCKEDGSDNSGAAHMGIRDLQTGLFHFYASLSLQNLAYNVQKYCVTMSDEQKNELFACAIKYAIEAFYSQDTHTNVTSYASNNTPDLSMLSLRHGMIMSLDNAFENPIENEKNYVKESIENFVSAFNDIDTGYFDDEIPKGIACFVAPKKWKDFVKPEKIRFFDEVSIEKNLNEATDKILLKISNAKHMVATNEISDDKKPSSRKQRLA